MRVLLPFVIEELIKSYLPPPSAWVPPYLRQLDTMRVSDWDDVQDVRAYGDY